MQEAGQVLGTWTGFVLNMLNFDALWDLPIEIFLDQLQTWVWSSGDGDLGVWATRNRQEGNSGWSQGVDEVWFRCVIPPGQLGKGVTGTWAAMVLLVLETMTLCYDSLQQSPNSVGPWVGVGEKPQFPLLQNESLFRQCVCFLNCREKICY